MHGSGPVEVFMRVGAYLACHFKETDEPLSFPYLTFTVALFSGLQRSLSVLFQQEFHHFLGTYLALGPDQFTRGTIANLIGNAFCIELAVEPVF